MASTVETLSGILHSSSLVNGEDADASHVVANLQQLVTKSNEIVGSVNDLVAEAASNTANLTTEETARIAADAALQDDVDDLDTRVSAIEGNADGSVVYGTGDVTLDEDDMAYRIIRKHDGGTVTLDDPATLGLTSADAGKLLTIVNEYTAMSASAVTVAVDQTGAGTSVLFQLQPGESVVFRYTNARWVIESAPTSAAHVTVTATSDREDDLYKFQDIHYLRTGNTAAQTITLPARDSFFTGQRVMLTVAGTADTDLSAASGDSIKDTSGTDTKVTVSAGDTVELVASEADTWHVVS